MGACHSVATTYRKCDGVAARRVQSGVRRGSKILRVTFGMELVELQTRAATHDTAGGATGKDKTHEKAATQNGDGGAGDGRLSQG